MMSCLISCCIYSLFVFRCAASLSHTISKVAASRQKHTLPDLTYDYGALEPYVSAEIMQLHHSKHHATYVNNLNVTEEKYQEALAKGMGGVAWYFTSLELDLKMKTLKVVVYMKL